MAGLLNTFKGATMPMPATQPKHRPAAGSSYRKMRQAGGAGMTLCAQSYSTKQRLGRRSTCCSSFATSSGPPETGVLEVSAAGKAVGELPAGEAGAEAQEDRCCLAAAMRCSRAALAAALSLTSCAVRPGSAALCKLAITQPHRQGLYQQQSSGQDVDNIKVLNCLGSTGHVSLQGPRSSKPQNSTRGDAAARKEHH